MDAEACIDQLPQKRTVTVTYRGVPIEVKVSTVTEELDMHIASALKARAVADGQIEEWYCESDLVPRDYKSPVGKVSAELVKDWAIARSKANAIFEDNEDSHSDELKRLILAKEGFLLQLDPIV